VPSEQPAATLLAVPRSAALFEFSTPAGAPADQKRPWWFEATGPAYFNAWSFAHVGWGALFQLLFPERYLTGLVLHTIYEAVEGHIFPAQDRDVSMENHLGDTIAFAAGMLAVPSMRARSASDMTRFLSEALARRKR